MLKQRLTTAILLVVPLIAVILYLPTTLVAVLLGVVVALGAWEWAGLAGMQQPAARLAYALLMVAVMLACAFILTPSGLLVITGITLLVWAAALLLVIGHERGHFRRHYGPVLMGCLGFFILVPPWLALLALHALSPHGVYWVLILFMLIWCADSAAYFCGRYWGRRRLAATVSPGKTLAGVGGALVADIVLVLVLTAAFAAPLQLQHGTIFGLLVLAVVTVLLSVLGDLTESLFKRLAGVKDSGNILPGHGGILDRIDSLTAAAPVYLAGLWLLGVYK